MTYAELVEVKSYMGITSDSDDVLLLSLLERATGIIESVTGRCFIGKKETRHFDAGYIDNELFLVGNDLLSVEKVFDGQGEEIALENVKLLPQSASPKWRVRLTGGASWNAGFDDEIAITGTWGYSMTPPADIVHATVRLTAFLYRQKDTSADLDRPLVTGDGVTIMPSALPNDVMALVRKYRRLV
ncbi:MAG TPA: phage head-tail connector protein [Anaerolineaceae bacterium]|nr:phage head-tail connector protein [Anaerolineaceae bacterium]